MTTYDDNGSATIEAVSSLTDLPASCRVGDRVQLRVGRLRVGEGVTINDDVKIVGDDVSLGAGVQLGSNTDLRASTLHIGAGSEVAANVRVCVAERFVVAEAARLAAGVNVVCRDFVAGRLLYMGDGATVGYGGTMTSTAMVSIGNRVTLGQHSILNANFPIEIGDNVGTGSYLAIWTHGYHFGHGPLEGTQPAYASVHIAANVWLGFQVTILPGVSIGENTMIAAGSVVTSQIPPDVLAGGVPAQVKKTLDRSPVPDAEARAVVEQVLQAWQAELQWKGCRVTEAFFGDDRVGITVAMADGSSRTRVVLVGPDESPPSSTGDLERLVLISVDPREDLAASAVGPVCAFELRAGALHGDTTPIVEDLRDQFRRFAMPCGETTCFTAIEPAAFARLRRAL